jgi:hypothetical protein
MTFLRRIFGEDAVVATPAPAPTPSAAAKAAAHAAGEPAREALLRAELEGADADKLTAFARDDKRAAMRLMAAEALVQTGAPKEVWESIVAAWQQKDRRLSKLAKEQLASFRSADDFHGRAAKLEADFSALLDKKPTDLTRLAEADRAYELLKTDARKLALEADLQAIAVVRGAIAERLESEQGAQRAVLDIEKLAHAVTAGLVAGTAKPDLAQHAELSEKLQALDVSAVPAAVVQRAHTALTNLQATLQAAVTQESADARAAQDAEHAVQAQASAADTEKAKEARKADDATRKAKAKEQEAKLETLVAALETQLASGEAKSALKRVAEVKAMRQVAEHAPGAWRARFHVVEGELLKLEGFARDNARVRRDELIEKAKKLPELALPPDALATEIQSLQTQWKAIDAEVGGAPGKLWDVFHGATDVAYGRVKAFRAVKAAERDVHAKAKETMLAELEAMAVHLAPLPIKVAKPAVKVPKAAAATGAVSPSIETAAPEADAVAEVTTEAISGATSAVVTDVKAEVATEVTAEAAPVTAVVPTPAEAAVQPSPAIEPLPVTEATAPAPTGETDWKALQNARAEAVKKWFDVGSVNRKEQKGLQDRFDTVVKRIDKALDGERAKEKRRRETLLASVEAAKAKAEAERPEHVDPKSQAWPALLDAMRVAQEAQKKWNERATPLQLHRKDEQKLWDKFRGVCNVVFEMRSAARDSVKAAFQADREKHALKIAEIRALSSIIDEKALNTALTEAQTAWRALGRPDRGAERQYDDAIEAARKQLTALKRDKQRGAWRMLAALDTALTALETTPGDEALKASADTARVACDAKQVAHAGLVARVKAAHAGAPLVATKGAPTKADLMLDLEMALDLSSPPEEATARRARQMAQLANAMKNRTARAEPTALFMDFMAIRGAVDAARLERIVARL